MIASALATPLAALVAPVVAQAQTSGLGEAVQTQAQGGGAAEFWVFWILAPLSLASGIAMVALRNPIHAALMLVVNLFTIAVFYAVLEGQFLAAIQVIVYAGAIMVLFLFVLMLLGTGGEEERRPERLRGQRTGALLLGVALVAGLIGAVASPFLRADSACSSAPGVQVAVQEAGIDARPCTGLTGPNGEEGGNPRAIGLSLYTDFVWPFEVTSVLLVVAAIGAMVLGKRDDPDELGDRPAVGEDADVEADDRVPAMVGAGGVSATHAEPSLHDEEVGVEPIGEPAAPADDPLLSGDDPAAPADADLEQGADLDAGIDDPVDDAPEEETP